MGNDHSRLKGLIIEQTVESTDFWTLSNASLPTTNANSDNEVQQQLLSVFQGEPIVSGQLWVQQGPMERAIKNLMIYRHPYILKYVCTWQKGGQKHLATERVHPLITILVSQSDIQVCLGLRTILCSLIFLIEKAMARHLNICTSSIYITDSGSWRLAGFEYVWKSKEVTKTLLDLAKAYRNNNAIDPCETKENNIDFIEQYAFATLCEEILSKCTKTDTATPHVQEFREYCATHLKHKNAHMRPKLSAVLLHPYFNHEFVLIHSFLFELPLKNVQEKQDFFTGLIDRLRYFNEEVVGGQLAADLLSRMVLLDPTAQLCVTPYVLKTKTDHSAALFSNQTYMRYLMPHIKRMFRLRDAQIRLILLEYFMEFVRLLTKQEIQEFILPHLIAGMNDTNDVLVAKTLRCLADLVPILGAATVLGGSRSRLFSDGRPQAAVPDSTTPHWVEPRSITPVMGGSGVDYMVSDSPLPDNMDLSGSFSSLAQVDNEQLDALPTRLSPDGGEDDKSAVISDGLNERQSNEAQIIAEPTAEMVNTINATTTPAKTMTKVVTGKPATQDEMRKLANETQSAEEEEEEAWSDWETDELQQLNGNNLHAHVAAANEYNLNDTDMRNTNNTAAVTNSNALPDFATVDETLASVQSTLATNSSSYATLPSQISLSDSYRTMQSNTSSMHSLKPAINDDLNALDIKVQKSATPLGEKSDEFDFFKDMVPVIETKWSALENSSQAMGSVNGAAATHKQMTAKLEEEILIDASRFAADSTDAIDDIEGAAWRLDDDDDDVDDDLHADAAPAIANIGINNSIIDNKWHA